MKIKQISDNELQIIITKNDMFGKNMRGIFRDIIEQARTQFGFEVVHNTSLMVEAYPLSEESMILTLTKLNAEDIIGQEFFVEQSQVDEPWAVFEFKDLEDVITLSELVKDASQCASSLYKYKGQFELYVDDVNNIEESMRGHFVEYGEIAPWSKDYLDEHGVLMIKEQALETLGNL
ncbi:MAG: adaptor protein MecA [Peptococcaceae bacterium]|nr:adaptor protein MecA [Peptococcaceae bacterium]